MKWYEEGYIEPDQLVKGGFSMTLNGVTHDIKFVVNGWRRWKGKEKHKEDVLKVPRNKWVDYQMESMFGGWNR